MPKIIICEVTGRTFEYRGRGRPPKFHPEVAEYENAKRTRQTRRKKSAVKMGAKLAARMASLSNRGD